MNPSHFEASRYHAEDLLRESEQARRVYAATAHKRRAARYAPVALWLADRMVAWGWRLRARYGDLELAGPAYGANMTFE
jgi:hypothetical protein